MPTVVGVKLRFSPKVLWFDPADSDPCEGDHVVVETERGRELGDVVEAPHDVAENDLPAPLKPVVRLATADDTAHAAELAEREHEAMPVYRQMVKEHKLDMKPIEVEYMFSGDRIVFYFSAEERVDFRELVRDLATRFKARIDMRQIGVRDEARLVGGVGHCGQPLCCVRFGGDFQPVSIRMAKEQDLPLNPLKISGLCGRLMCCLRYEYDAYKDFKTRAPKRGAIVETPVGLGKITELNTPLETVTVKLEDGSNFTVPLAGMCCSKGTGCPCSVTQEALDAVRPASSLMAMAETAAAPPKESKQRQSEQRQPRRRKQERRDASTGKPAAQASGERKATRGQEGARADAGVKKGDAAAGSDQAPRSSSGRRRRRRRPPGGSGDAAAPKPEA